MRKSTWRVTTCDNYFLLLLFSLERFVIVKFGEAILEGGKLIVKSDTYHEDSSNLDANIACGVDQLSYSYYVPTYSNRSYKNC